MAKVKGTLLLEYVRLIKNNKDKNWQKYLTEEDIQIVFGSVMASAWYPIEIFERVGNAVFNEIAEGKLELSKLWGKFAVEDIVKRYYRSLVQPNDPMGSFERFRNFTKQWYQFDDPKFQPLEIVREAPNCAKITLRDDHPYDFFDAYAHQITGEFERIVELDGGKEVVAKITECDYKARQPWATIMVSWK